MDEITCHYIDRLVTIEMRAGRGEIPRGVTHRLYEAARAAQDDRALTFLAADGLRKALTRGDHVLIATGAGTPPWLPKGETDGPPGAAAIARALDIGLGAKPIVVGEERNIGPIIASLEGIGLVVNDEAQFAQRDGCALVIPMPLGAEPGAAFARDIFARFAPKAAVFVEKAGPNSEGYYNSLLGTGRTKDMMANAELLAAEAKAAGVFTLGIGDGGNEIGFGKAAEAIRDIQPWGRRSRRPDGSPGVGIVTVTETDVLLAAAVSNWGGYGVAAALAALEGRPEILHSVADERRMLNRCVEAGAVDGVFCRPVPMADGTSEETQFAMITMLHDIVASSLRTVKRSF
ncbi:glutamate cyclase domain-containing protein [Roseomonas sp. WA12]